MALRRRSTGIPKDNSEKKERLFCQNNRSYVVDLKGFEPSTSRMRTERSPS